MISALGLASLALSASRCQARTSQHPIDLQNPGQVSCCSKEGVAAFGLICHIRCFPGKNRCTYDVQMEQWLAVQSMWMYMEAVFSSGDIVRQLPLEAKRFQNIDKNFVKVRFGIMIRDCFFLLIKLAVNALLHEVNRMDSRISRVVCRRY